VKIIPFVFGVLWAATGFVFGTVNAVEWLIKGHREPVGSGYMRFTRWQWAVAWTCVLGIGLWLAVWSE
jgi:hypothetical protein